MRRRQFVAAAGPTVLWPFASTGQQSGQVRRIGYVSPAAQHNPVDEAFEDGLRQLGWAKLSIQIEYRYTAGRQDRSAPIVEEIAGLRPDLIVAWGPPLTRAVKKAAPQTPLVFLNGYDPIEEDLVSNLARPGGYVTGVAGFPTSQLIAKRLQLLKEIVPNLGRIAVLHSTEQTYTGALKSALTVSASTLNVALDDTEVATPANIERGLREAKTRGAQALYVWPSGFAFAFARHISETANDLRLPTIHPYREGAFAGGLLSYSADLRSMALSGASYVDKILKGTMAGDLPVEQPTKIELVVNLKTATALGLTIPASILARADEVIE